MARVVNLGTIFGHEFINVWYLDVTHTAPVTTDDMLSLCEGVRDAWDAHLSDVLDSSETLIEVDVSFHKVGGGHLEFSLGCSLTGAGADPLEDAAASYVINHKIDSSYRGGHPRTYLPGVKSLTVANGSDITVAGLSALGTAWGFYVGALNMISTSNVTEVQVGSVRFEDAGAWLTPPVFYPWTSSIVRRKLGSQRRRILS